jgi:acylphosphatase
VIRRRLWVAGDVQGVFFRDTCRSVAEKAGVTGSAANLSDGRVEIVLEGEPQAVEKVIDWCRSGTRGARVSSVDITDEEPTGERSFRVL